MKGEHSFSCAVARYLRMRGYITLDTDVMSALRYLPSKDAQRRVSYINSHVAMGYTKGQSDLVVVSKNGKVTFVELKNGNSYKQSPMQKVFQQEIEKRGAKYIVIKSIDDLESFCGEDNGHRETDQTSNENA